MGTPAAGGVPIAADAKPRVSASVRAVFLSYASEDAASARRISEALRAAGVEVWFDQNELRGGDAWDQSIRKQIKSCALFIPIISVHAHDRVEGYFRLEWKLAVDRSHLMAPDQPFLLPVAVDATPQTDSRIPERFRELQWSRATDDRATAALVERVVALLSPASGDLESGTPASPAPAPAAAAGRHPDAATLRPSRRAMLALATLLVIGATLFVGGRIWLASRSSGAAPPVAEKSIAVLPFADLSEAHDQEYFSDGLAEELLDLLARNSSLRVIARTSSFSFKGKQATVAEIAKTLSVAYVLEGSVRKAGSRLRVSTQLIRTENGAQLWSETYDRELRDVFAVQDEIAGAVAGALRVHLAGTEGAPRVRQTVVPAAYDRFLLGRELMTEGTRDSGFKAAAAFEEATRLDPSFAQAFAALGSSAANSASLTDDATGYRQAEIAIDRALTLEPQLSDAFVARARLRLYTLDFRGAQSDVEQALRLAPGDSRGLVVAADTHAAFGRIEEADAVLARAVALDPLNRAGWSHRGNYLLARHELAAARVSLERALELAPKSESALAGLETLDLLEGHPEHAVARLQSDPSARGTPPNLMTSALAEHSLGHGDASARTRDDLIRCCARYSAYQIATIYAWSGDKPRALDWLERAYQQRDSGLASLKADPLLNSLRGEPRYAALLTKLGLSQ